MNLFLKFTAALSFAALAGTASAAGYTGLYVFGDSLSDRGNVAAAAGIDATQVVANNFYVPDLPYASGQFTNGDVWVKSFAASLGLAPYGQASLTGGGDYAFGGARIATRLNGQPPSVSDQAGLFLTATGNIAPSGALYVVEGGGNDARDALVAAATAATPADGQAKILAAASAYASSTHAIVDQLQAAGAQHIVVWDVPNLALVPGVIAQGLGATFLGGLVTQTMNNALSAELAGESGVSIFDLTGLQATYAANPGAFGLTNVTDACGAAVTCTSGYLYWDSIHPSATGHALLAEAMLAHVAVPVPEPATWAMLGAGLLLISRRVPTRLRRQAAA